MFVHRQTLITNMLHIVIIIIIIIILFIQKQRYSIVRHKKTWSLNKTHRAQTCLRIKIYTWNMKYIGLS